MQYKFPLKGTKTINKFGVDISIYNAAGPTSFVYEETDLGHFEEFYDTTSTYTWFIIEGEGTFVINDEKYTVKPKDLIVIPPNTRVHYFGRLKMLLAASPAYSPDNERHVRNVNPSENPYT
jgi:hypothetical protein